MFKKLILNIFVVLIASFLISFQVQIDSKAYAQSTSCLGEKPKISGKYTDSITKRNLSSRIIGNLGEELSDIYLQSKYCHLTKLNLKYANPDYPKQGLRGIDHTYYDKDNKKLLIFETKTSISNEKYLFLENDYQLSNEAIIRGLKKSKPRSDDEKKIYQQLVKLINNNELKIVRTRIGWYLKEFKAYLIEYEEVATDKALATGNIAKINNTDVLFELVYNKCFNNKLYKCSSIR